MRKIVAILAIAVVVAAAMPAFAELQNVTVGGSVRIRGNYITNTFTPGLAPEMRWPASVLGRRAIGGPFNPNVMSIFDWDDRGGDMKFVEHRTRLNARADFTEEVSAFIELESYDIWGQDFRSNYITGADGPGNTVDDVEVYQAYIEANEMWDQPIRLRVGRQELSFGSQWLVGPNDFCFFFTGLSFDAVRLTYTHDLFTVDAWWSKLAETSPLEEDGDVDFYGVYASYLGLENVTLDGYWLLVRDARALEDIRGGWVWERVEDLWGVDDYDVTYLNTVGLRGAGAFGAFDFDAEVAYQFGDADQIGATFKPAFYGDDDADFDEWGAKVDLGYTLDVRWQPRLFVGTQYYGGEDNRDVSFWEWLNPFDRPEASISFNRLFSNSICSGFLDLNNELSNAWLVKGGVVVHPTEKLMGVASLTYVETLEAFDAPVHLKLGRLRVPVAPALSWWTRENDDDLGVELDLFFWYNYTEDLTFKFGYAHLFLGDGLEDGNYSRWNGLLFNGGTDDDAADYFYVGSSIEF